MAVAHAAGTPVERVVVAAEEMKDHKAKTLTGKFPYLETPEGCLVESLAIAGFLAHGKEEINGSTNLERAKIDEWCQWMVSKVFPAVIKAVYCCFGHIELSQADFNEGAKAAKDFAREIEKALTGDFLVGNHATMADYCVGLLFAPVFQTLLDGGFRKAAPKTSAWFERVCKLPSVVATHGHIKACAKPLKPMSIKVEVKKVVAKAVEVAKPVEKKPEKNPLELLPETKFDLFNFKTFFVNVKD